MKKTAIYNTHIFMGAKMIPFAGFYMPIKYTNIQEEHMSVRNFAGIFDVSHMGEFFIEGNEAENLLQYLTTNNISYLKIGQAQYSCMTNELGGIVDDLIIYKLNNKKFMLVVNASNIKKNIEWIKSHNNFSANFYDVSSEYSLLAIQGPFASKILQPLTNIPLQKIPFYHFIIGTFAEIDQVIISATGYTGSPGFELYLKNEYAEKTWEKIFHIGINLGIKACGLASRDTLRIEMGYRLYGQDINEETTPLEAGLSWITKFDKDFIGKNILFNQKENGINKKLIAFILEGKGIPRKGYIISDLNKNLIGNVTSGTFSPILKKGIGLGYVPISFAKELEKLQILIRNKYIPIKIIKLPFINI